MIDLKLLRESPEVVRESLRNRHNPFDLDNVLELDARRRKLQYEVEQLKAEQNKTSEEIAKLKKAKQDASAQIAAMKSVSDNIKSLDEQLKQADADLSAQLMLIPNIPDQSVPIGPDDSANRVERHWGAVPEFSFQPKEHVEIGEGLGILDFERAAKLSGARFSLSKGPGALLERALINLMLDTHTRENGYTEILPPFMVNSDSMRGTGQLPKFAEDLFRIQGFDLWLIPTAEVPVTNIFRDDIVDESMLPISYCAYTPCFRSEAGSYGKDTRGMIRQHQFNKVELVKFTAPEQSWDELERLTNNAESILQKLGLAYRVVTLSTGDMGFSSAKTYDIEVWLPGQNCYREISSCSNFLDFQARRANIRYRGAKKPQFVHTLNGSGLAVGRTLVAVLENYQQEDGSVLVPPALRPYMHGMERIEAIK
jgi:seryl-tRNA synthetase